jgi:hypothetical protein
VHHIIRNKSQSYRIGKSIDCDIDPDRVNIKPMEQSDYMKAIVFTKYGPPGVLKLKEIEKPILKEKDVLVKVLAASVNALSLL